QPRAALLCAFAAAAFSAWQPRAALLCAFADAAFCAWQQRAALLSRAFSAQQLRAAAPSVDQPPSLAFDPRMPSPCRRRCRGSGTPGPDPGTSAAEPPSTALSLAALSTAPLMATPSTVPATTALAPAVSSGEVDALAAAAAIPLPADEPMLDLPSRTVLVFGSVEVPLALTVFSVADVDLTALSTLKRQHASTWRESATTTLGVKCATVIFRDFAPAIDAVVADHSVSLADLTTALRELEPAVMEAATVYRRNHGTLAHFRQTLTSATHR
ncbi:MAG: hypothetical protein BJ554DRAFT_683, partial [Olpidium bornovanus]